MEEIWKDIEGYEGKYMISSCGNVKSINYHGGHREKILMPNMNTGYPYVVLCKEGKIKHMAIHRLVAKAFVPNPLMKPQVNHIDGNKRNNSFENLEWVTQLENNLHAYRVLKKHPMRGYKYDKNKNSKKVKQFLISEEGYTYHIATYANAEVAAMINHLNMGGIRSCCRNDEGYKEVGGYFWEYEK